MHYSLQFPDIDCYFNIDLFLILIVQNALFTAVLDIDCCFGIDCCFDIDLLFQILKDFIGFSAEDAKVQLYILSYYCKV